MKNLACRITEYDYKTKRDVLLPDANEKFEEVDDAVLAELAAAGIEPSDMFTSRMCANGTYKEVPTKYIGVVHQWRFERGWYYWVATGPGIPPDDATKLHEQFGKEVRVDGHCGCPSPNEWFCGFAVDCYHVDTQEGLNALAELIRTIRKRGPAITETGRFA